ncbi:MAG: hypothetical protein BGO13_04910 [Burkholderiales bacterium 66-5]|nr:MAG: hypothetical protein BGO13_04910 [Burkholderiales bacterium 66-5]
MHALEVRHGAKLRTHAGNQVLADFFIGVPHPHLEHHQAQRHLALERIGHAHHRRLCHVGMRGQNLFHLPGGEPVPRHVDDVVDA